MPTDDQFAQLRDRLIRVEKILYLDFYQRMIEAMTHGGTPAEQRTARSPEIAAAYQHGQQIVAKLMKEVYEGLQAETGFDVKQAAAAPAEPPKERGQLLEID